MADPMLAELDEVVRLMEAATPGEWYWNEYTANLVTDKPGDGQEFEIAAVYSEHDDDREPANSAAICAAMHFLRAHHATLADMAKRLEAAEEAYRKMLAGIDAEQLVAASKKHGDALSVLKDAGRYRHFRRQIATGRCEILHDLDVGYPLHADDPVGTLERFIDSKLDAAIDAAQEGEG